jgi:geranylgeranyl diphosphate synthase type 3
MDDVEDNSELRRGEPVAHTIYGVPQTINTANYVYFQAVQELLKLQHNSTSQDDKKGKGKGKGKEGDLIGLVTGTSTLFSDMPSNYFSSGMGWILGDKANV